MSNLQLALKAEYFAQIKAGVKAFEYRLCTPYWTKRLAKAPFRRLVLTKGYPPASDASRRLVLPWRGYCIDTITHPHFGPGPVEVFAIIVCGLPGSKGEGA